MPEPHVLYTGLAFGESPRWHDGRLFVSDWGAREVIAIDDVGTAEVVARVPTAPFCLDFLPDGRLLVVSGGDARLLRREPDGSLVTHAELTGVSDKPWNDIVADASGNAYVNTIGFDFPGGDFAPGTVALVAPDGSVRSVADGLAFPNGMALTADGATLIVAESYARRLTAFDVATDGGLSGRRVWADLGDGVPDGICVDAEGAVWYSDVPGRCCVRVREGGEILRRIDLDRGCFACMLGGTDGQTLFLVATTWSGDINAGDAARTGQVLTVRVPVPHAGRP